VTDPSQLVPNPLPGTHHGAFVMLAGNSVGARVSVHEVCEPSKCDSGATIGCSKMIITNCYQ
jgi:hypothetical protein